MLDLLDCLMPACHEESAVTTPTVADVTFGAVIALAAVIEKHAPALLVIRDAAADGLAADLDPALPVVVCGHSLGGALATLLVADLTANTPLKPQAWTFASPKVGDAVRRTLRRPEHRVMADLQPSRRRPAYFPVDVTE